MKPRSIMAVSVPLLLFAVVTLHAVQPTNIPSYKPFLGLAYSPFQGNESPALSTYPSASEIEYDLTNKIVFLASEIALYGMAGTQSNIPALCNTYNIQCYPCAYLNTDPASNSNELNALIAIGNQNFPTTRGLIVGSETMIYGYDPAELINQINYVRAATHNTVPVGTRDIPYNFMKFPAVAQACDFIHADIHPYWADVPESDGVAWTISEWQQLTNEFPGVRVEIGETGWPTGGTNVNFTDPNIVPSLANQDAYIAQFVPVARSMGIEYFIFDFRDEAWKTSEGFGTVETNWGVYFGNNVRKPALTDFLTSGFTENILSANPAFSTIQVNTYEGDPYYIYSTTNIIQNQWYFVSTFSGAAGTNQTVVSVPNPFNSHVWLYRAIQGF